MIYKNILVEIYKSFSKEDENDDNERGITHINFIGPTVDTIVLVKKYMCVKYPYVDREYS